MMILHLAAISVDLAAGCHAALLLEQAGWHLSNKLAVPHNIPIELLPPLTLQENVWQFRVPECRARARGPEPSASQKNQVREPATIVVLPGERPMLLT
jgi:hypothetical protein